MVDELIKILEQDSAKFRSFQDYSCAVTELLVQNSYQAAN